MKIELTAEDTTELFYALRLYINAATTLCGFENKITKLRGLQNKIIELCELQNTIGDLNEHGGIYFKPRQATKQTPRNTK